MRLTLPYEKQQEIEQACQRLVLDAAAFTDRQEYAELAALFTTEGKLYRPADPQNPLVGGEAICAAYLARPRQRITRHICSNIRVTLDSLEQARVHCYVQVFAANTEHDKDGHFGWPVDGRVMVGEFDDLCVVENGEWLFAERRAQFVMYSI